MHKPVLLNEVIKYLEPKPGENFIDCTIGEAGHGLAVLEKTKPNGKVLGIDTDLEAIQRIESRIMNYELRKRLILVHGNFRDLKKIVQEKKLQPVNGILFDLGLSSRQIEESGRGFSFKKDELLDMRFGQAGPIAGPTAREIIKNSSQEELAKIFQQYGEEKYGWRIARAIKKAPQPIETTFQLKELVKKSAPFSKVRRGSMDRVLARIFQSLRIAVNDELENLKQGLEQALEILIPEGRMVVISFHSLEDRIVKRFFREKERGGFLKVLTKKPVGPSNKEIQDNPRSRSAKLRAAWKNGQA